MLPVRSLLYLPAAFFTALYLPQAAAAEALQTGRVLAYANQFPPSACAVLSHQPLPGAENFVKVLQDGREIASPISLGENEICAGQLQHGAVYELHLARGLPAAGAELMEDTVVELTVPNAREELSFKQGTLLPRAEQSFMELDCVNLDKVQLYLFKLSLNDLSAVDLNHLLSSSLETYQLTSLLDSHASQLSTQLFELQSPANQKTTLKIDLTSAVEQSEGLILALACDPALALGLNPGADGDELGSIHDLYDTKKAFAAKLINASDITISSYRGSSLTVMLRSLKTARPLKDARVSLLARNNAVLAEAVSDSQGQVSFGAELLQGQHADTPSAILVRHEQDTALLSLAAPEIYLPEENVNPPLKNSLQVFATAGRGILRPGETVNISVLVRGDDGSASAEPLACIIKGPNGVELQRSVLQGQELGTYFVTAELSATAPRGTYSAVFMQGRTEINRLNFTVADFVPATLQLQAGLSPAESGQDEYSVQLQALFNYGAPASDLETTATLQLRPDQAPLKNFTDYHFGPSDPDSLQQMLPLSTGRTDADGRVNCSFALPATPWAAELDFTAEVFDLNHESAVINRQFKLPPAYNLIGLKKEGESMAVVYAAPDGSEASGDLSYTVYQLQTHFQYVYDYGRWNYRRQESRRPVSAGMITAAAGRAELPLSLEDGRYVIEIRDSAGASSALEFTRGFASSDNALESPERVILTLNQEKFVPGDKFRLSFDSPFAGYGTLLLAKAEVLETRSFKVERGHNEITLPFKAEYAPGIKALLSLYAPLEDNPAGVVRAAGIISVSADNEQRRISLQLHTPKSIKPGDPVHIEITSDYPGEFYLQPYLVDSGILSLTNFKAPDPFAAVFGPRAGALTLQDNYRFLMRSADPYSQGYGADEAAALAKSLSALSSIPREIYAKSMPPLLITDGRAELDFTAPQLSGELTFMVLASSREGLGSAAVPVTLQDDLNVTLALPRFMRSDDVLTGEIAVTNTAADTEIQAELSCSGALDCALAESAVVPAGGTTRLSFDLKGLAAGTGSIFLKITAGDFLWQETKSLTVLPPYSRTMLTAVQALQPGQSAEVSFAGTDFARVEAAATTLSRLPLVNSELFIEQLIDLPEWSTDIYAIKALALLQAEAAHLPGTADIDDSLLQRWADHILAAQLSDGSFNLYRSDPDYYTTVLCTYALAELRGADFAVPENALRLAFRALDRAVRWGSDSARAMAYLTKLKFERVSMSELYYFSTEESLKSVEALAVLSHCFAHTGDYARAQELARTGFDAFFELSRLQQELKALPYTAETREERQALQQRIRELSPSNSSSLIYDGCLLLSSSLDQDKKAELTETLLSMNLDSSCYKAAELGGMLAAQASLPDGSNLSRVLEHSGLPPYQVTNETADPLYAVSSIIGLTASAPPAQNLGVELGRAWFTLNGEPVTLPAQLKLNQNLIVRLQTKLRTTVTGSLILRDAIPSGFTAAEASGLPEAVVDRLCGSVRSFPEGGGISESEYLAILDTWQDEQCVLYLLRPGYSGTVSAPPAQLQLDRSSSVRAVTEAQKAAFVIKP